VLDLQTSFSKDDINALKSRIRELNAEMTEISEKKNVTSDPMEDKLTLFRQQAAIVARKKEGTAERLNETRLEKTSANKKMIRQFSTNNQSQPINNVKSHSTNEKRPANFKPIMDPQPSNDVISPPILQV